MRFFALAVVVYCYFAPGLAFAQDTARQLAGSWKLTSWTIQIIGGDVTEPFGRDPKGRALITPDGYAAFVIAAANRKGGGKRCGVGSPPQDTHGLHRSIHNRGRQVHDQGRHILE